jgi:hypothetical protein
MPDTDLSTALAALRPPPGADAARDRALYQATLALRAGASHLKSSPTLSSGQSGSMGWRVLVTSLVAVVLLALGAHFTSSVPVARPASAPDFARVLAELDQLFPGQVEALVEKDGALQIDVAVNPGSGAQTPLDQSLVIEFVRAENRLRIVAYSGRSVRLQLDGVALRFDPLLTAERTVVLAGEDFIWTPGDSAPRALAGWHIEARPLRSVL